MDASLGYNEEELKLVKETKKIWWAWLGGVGWVCVCVCCWMHSQLAAVQTPAGCSPRTPTYSRTPS